MVAKHERARRHKRIDIIIAAAWPMLGLAPLVGPSMQNAALGAGPPVEPDAYFFWNGPGVVSADNPTSGDVSDPNNWGYGPGGPPPNAPPPPPGPDEIATISTNSDTGYITLTGNLSALGIGVNGVVNMTGPVAAGLDGLGTGADIDFATTLGPNFTNTVTSASDLLCFSNVTFESSASVNITGASWFATDAVNAQDTILCSFTAGGGALVDSTVGVYGGAMMTVDTNTPGQLLPDSELAFYSAATALQASGNLFINGSALQCNGDAAIGTSSTNLALVDVNSGGRMVTTGVTHIGVNDPYNDSDNWMPGSGVVIVSDAGSTWEPQSDVRVGDDEFAGGSIYIQDGGILQLDAGVNVRLGAAENGSGVLTFDGTGATPYLFSDSTSSIIVGDQGYGNMNIQNGAALVHGGSIVVGNEDTSNGELDITGAGSSLLSVGSFDVGDEGTGTMNIDQGAEATILELTVGSESTGDGAINVGPTASGSLTVLGTLTVGDAGTGTLVASAGSTLAVRGRFTIGGQSSGSGTVTLDGATLSFAGTLVIGDSGQGQLQMQDGAINALGTLAAPMVTLAEQANSTGTLSLDGLGTILQVSGLTVGDGGGGMLNLINSALVTCNGDASVGEQVAGVISSAAVASSSVLSVNGNLTVGSGGIATMQITTGGEAAASGTVSLGDESGSSGTVTVDGLSSSLKFGTTLIVGNSGIGNLSITGGASAAPLPSTVGEVDVAAKTGSSGTVTISGTDATTGTASMLSANTLAVGGTISAAGGTGSLTVSSSGKLAVAGLVKVWNNGQVNLDVPATTFGNLAVVGNGVVNLNGTLLINYGTPASDPAAAIFSYLHRGYAGGEWNGTGIDSTSVAGLNASQSKLIYSVGYADGSDGITGVPSGKIEILPTLAGDAKLQGNVVFGDFQLLSQYFGQTGTTWDEGNFSYGSSTNFGDFQLLSQNFGANASGLTNGEVASLNSFASQFGDEIVASPDGVGFSLVSVPEPTSMGLLLLAGSGLFARWRRKMN